jgi:hypothetical protein
MRARFVPILFLAAVALSTCISDSAAPSPAVVQESTPDLATIKAEREATSRTYVLCLMRAAKKLDDRKSDPHTIAEAMISACATEFDATVEVHSRYLEAAKKSRRRYVKPVSALPFNSCFRIERARYTEASLPAPTVAAACTARATVSAGRESPIGPARSGR